MLTDQTPQPDKWYGIGAGLAGFLLAIWAKMRWLSRDEINAIVDERLRKHAEEDERIAQIAKRMMRHQRSNDTAD
jgi:hypothetical protein